MNAVIKLLHLKGLQRRIILFRVNRILAGTKESGFEKKRKLLNKLDGFEIGEGTKVVGPVEVYGAIKTGKNCWIGKNLRVNGNGSVTIGDNCDIAPEVTFQTGSHKIGDANRRAGEGVSVHQEVGAGTWIGVRSTIINNTHIGTGCIIAACSCVIQDVEDHTLAGGVPARKIRDLKNECT